MITKARGLSSPPRSIETCLRDPLVSGGGGGGGGRRRVRIRGRRQLTASGDPHVLRLRASLSGAGGRGCWAHLDVEALRELAVGAHALLGEGDAGAVAGQQLRGRLRAIPQSQGCYSRKDRQGSLKARNSWVLL